MSTKRRKRKRLNRKLLIFPLMVALAFVTVMIQNRSKTTATDIGQEYLALQESRDISELNAQLTAKTEAEVWKRINSGQASVFDLFQDYVILGDSRAYGFSSYGFLDSSRVLANAGNTIMNVDDYVDVVESLQPSTVYISYGINDMGLSIGYQDGQSGYGSVLEEQVNKILAVDPGAEIVVNSVIHADPDVTKANERWGYVEDYNKEIKQVCDSRGWIYVSNDDITKKGEADIYGGDGIHFSRDFYTTWVENMMKTRSQAKVDQANAQADMLKSETPETAADSETASGEDTTNA